jgi:cytochrome c biogenesis protein CcdA
VLAYAAGVVGTLSPCVLPVLPSISAAAIRSHRLGPAVLALGAVVSFTVIGFVLALTGSVFGLDQAVVRMTGAIVMVVFGVLLAFQDIGGDITQRLFAALGERFSNRLARITSEHLGAQFTIGLLIGAVWTPCVGATLGAAVSLASQGERPVYAIAVMFLFGVGVMTPFLAIAYGLRTYVERHRTKMVGFSRMARCVLGVILIAFGLSVLTGLDKRMEQWAVERMPESLATFLYGI